MHVFACHTHTCDSELVLAKAGTATICLKVKSLHSLLQVTQDTVCHGRIICPLGFLSCVPV